MNDHLRKVAIIGGGPAGAACAERLASSGLEVVVFEGRPGWEKPCAGGITPPLWSGHSWLGGPDPAIVDVREVKIDFMGGSADVPLSRPIKVTTRKHLHQLMRRRSEEAGAMWMDSFAREIVDKDRSVLVDGEAFDFVVGADGATSTVRRKLARPLPREDMASGVGMYVPSKGDGRIVIRMLPDLCGYAWIFPREDHCSVGVVTPALLADRGRLIREAESLANDHLSSADVRNAEHYAAALPAVRGGLLFEEAMFGGRFALVGDAAGLCDPVTGEGIRWAIVSAGLAADAILAGDPRLYGDALRLRVIPELAAASRLASLIMRRGPMVLAGIFAPRSRSLRDMFGEFMTGELSYTEIKRALIGRAPSIFLQALVKIFFR